MSHDDSLEPLFQEISCDDARQQQQQQEQRPFSIVLIDIRKAAFDKRIHCVEKPLIEKDLSFVAISYRWGELQETTVDTHLGYTVSVTSFDLDDFFLLCWLMSRKVELTNVNYVWIDAICIDQNNPFRRKSTIHQMSNIYERATLILAVPDLHLKHLKNISTKNRQIIENTFQHRAFIDHLIRGNADRLVQMDIDFLDVLLPGEHELVVKRFLTRFTDYFANGWIHNKEHAYDHVAEKILGHLYEISQLSLRQHNDDDDDVVYHCDRKDCPLDLFDHPNLWQQAKKIHPWHQQINERNIAIRQSMIFLMDLIRDWSSRVWVISEYHIARKNKKNNHLKYWFLQLEKGDRETPDFFTFDFNHLAYAASSSTFVPNSNIIVESTKSIHMEFHAVMVKQLYTQTFLEMMLKSKASKNEDRFYAVLPQSEYENKMLEVVHWQIDTMVSVKLKLYEIMNTRDKLKLLFLSGNGRATNTGFALPTFATSNIGWEKVSLDLAPCNFDLKIPWTITLHHHDGHYYLKVIPMTYYLISPNDIPVVRYDSVLLRKLLQLDDDDDEEDDDHSTVDFVSFSSLGKQDVKPTIPEKTRDENDHVIALAGNFVKNKWILCRHRLGFSTTTTNNISDQTYHIATGFHIY